MKKTILMFCICFLIIGCGPHRITFVRSSLEQQTNVNTFSREQQHSHGIGPLIIGGGIGAFWLMNEISPALFHYTGDAYTTDFCPDGFVSVTHNQTYGQNTIAALISWVVAVNAYQTSKVHYTCISKPAVVNEPAYQGEYYPQTE